jgi:hypothetical protein
MLNAPCSIRRPRCYTMRSTTSRTVMWILAVPPLILLLSMLLSGREGKSARPGGGVWRFSAAHMEERAYAIQNVILPEAVSPCVSVERGEAYNPDGSWRGLWSARVSDQHGFLFTVVWEDATGELLQFSRTKANQPRSDCRDVALRSAAEAVQAAKNWIGKLSPISDQHWRASETAKLGGAYWRTYLVSPDGRMLVQMEAATGKPTYLAFRPTSFVPKRLRSKRL